MGLFHRCVQAGHESGGNGHLRCLREPSDIARNCSRWRSSRANFSQSMPPRRIGGSRRFLDISHSPFVATGCGAEGWCNCIKDAAPAQSERGVWPGSPNSLFCRGYRLPAPCADVGSARPILSMRYPMGWSWFLASGCCLTYARTPCMTST